METLLYIIAGYFLVKKFKTPPTTDPVNERKPRVTNDPTGGGKGRGGSSPRRGGANPSAGGTTGTLGIDLFTEELYSGPV